MKLDTDLHCARQPTTDSNIESISQVSDVRDSIEQRDMTEKMDRFTEWGRTYGPIISLKLGPQDLVVLNTASAVHE